MASAPPFVYPDFTYPEHLNRYASLTLDKIRKTRPVGKAVGSVAILARSPKPSLLLLRRAESEEAFPDKLELPGGTIELWDKSVAHGAVREVKEETGISINHIDGLVAYQPFKHRHKDELYVKWTFLAVLDKQIEVKVNMEEHSTAKWCDFEDIPGMCPDVTDDIQYRAIELAIMVFKMNCQGFSEISFFDVKGSSGGRDASPDAGGDREGAEERAT